MDKPLAVDLCAGLCGWGEGLISEGWRVRAYDIEDMFAALGEPRPEHVELVIRNVLEMHGSELADADLIVASPPCTEYSYMAMPWSRAKQIGRALRGEDEFPEPYRGSRTVEQLNAIFDACFRLQREAGEAAGRHIPMVVENVRGAIPWVGKAAWNYGSYYLWGDVPALMPSAIAGQKFNPDGTDHGPGSWFAIADSKNRGAKNPGFRFDGSGRSFQSESVKRHVDGVKVPGVGACWKHPSDPRHRPGLAFNPAAQGARVRKELSDAAEGRKGAGAAWFDQNLCQLSSKSSARKAASAKIAKIPLALSSHIARVYKPQRAAA